MRKLIAKIIYPDIFKDYHRAIDQRDKYYNSLLEHKQLLEISDSEYDKLDSHVKELNEEIINLEIGGVLDIDKFLTTIFKEIPLFAYKNKRKYKNFKYSVYVNEMIQPYKFLVNKVRKEIGKLDNNNLKRAEQIANYVDRQLHWQSDIDTTGMLDYYHSPVESLVSKYVDCDSHAILMASIDPNLFAIAFGNSGNTWHSWNVFEYDSNLWCADTNTVANFKGTGNVRIFNYNNQKKYKIYKIFTKDRTYVVNDSVEFGEVETL